MVGWSRRNAESARASRIAHEKYMKWFESLTSEQQLEEILRVEAQEKKERPKLIAIVIAALLFMFVGWPLTAIFVLAPAHQKMEWNSGKVISETKEQVCKEIDSCRPCVPVRHSYKRTECRTKEKAP